MGRWHPALALLGRAEVILRQRCTGVAWELDTIHVFTLWSLFYAGDLGEMSRRCAACLKEADERGDLYESANLGSFVGPLVRLVDDDLAGARQVLQSSVERWSPPGFHLQNVTALMADTYIDLYAGDFEAAWERWRQRWADVLGSHFLYVQVLRVFVHELHARTALAVAIALGAAEAAAAALPRRAPAGSSANGCRGRCRWRSGCGRGWRRCAATGRRRPTCWSTPRPASRWPSCESSPWRRGGAWPTSAAPAWRRGPTPGWPPRGCATPLAWRRR